MSDSRDKSAQRDEQQLPLYLSEPGPCPYLDDRTEQTIFTKMDKPSVAAGSMLIKMGFRRSQNIFYRPQCPGCTACTPLRLPVAEFTPSKTQKRIAKKNADLSASVIHAQATQEHYDLFQRYVAARHNEKQETDGGMADMDYDAFRTMIERGAALAHILQLRDTHGHLKGAVLYDSLSDGTSAIYSYYDPQETKRSLGVFLVLCLIEHTRALGKEHVYLGYWIEQSRKMSYKTTYRPYELFLNNRWTRP